MVKVTIHIEKVIRGLIMSVAVFFIAIGITGIIFILANPTVEYFETYYLTRGLPISLISYKVTRKYYGTYQQLKEKAMILLR